MGVLASASKAEAEAEGTNLSVLSANYVQTERYRSLHVSNYSLSPLQNIHTYMVASVGVLTQED